MATTAESETKEELRPFPQAEPVGGPPEQAEQPRLKLPPLWRNRDYMLLWSGQVVSTVGSSASGIVFPLLMLAITNSPAAAGLAGALFMLPYLLFSLPAGALVDRWDRKRVMIICDALRALNFATIPVAMLFFEITVWQLYINAFIEGTFFVFFSISEVAALPRVVSKAQLPDAAAQNQATFAVAGIIGPSVGTFLYQGVSRMAPFIFDAVSYAISVVSLTFIRTDFQRERTSNGEKNLRREIAEGVRWLWAEPLVRFIAFLGSGMNLLLAPQALILILLAKNLGASDAAIGTLFSAGSIGGIAGAVVASRILKRFALGRVITGVLWLTALAYPLYALAPNIYVLGLISAAIFSLLPILNVASMSYRAALVPDELQGRVSSVFRLVAWSSQPVGALLGGLLLERTGVITTLVISCVGWLLLAALATFNSHVRNARPLGEGATP
jgi:MFS family permease